MSPEEENRDDQRRAAQPSSSTPAAQQGDQESRPPITLSREEFHAIIQTNNSPVPRADELERINDVVPNGGERLFQMVEKQQQHRLSVETKLIESDIRARDRGFWAGLGLTVLVVTLGFILVLRGHDLAGAVIATTALASVLAAFVIGRSQGFEDLGRKRQRMFEHSRRDSQEE